MERYLNKRGNSSVEAYVIGDNYIDVKFLNSTKIYRYSPKNANNNMVGYMKHLARKGIGLNRFIKKYANNAYD